VVHFFDEAYSRFRNQDVRHVVAKAIADGSGPFIVATSLAPDYPLTEEDFLAPFRFLQLLLTTIWTWASLMRL
jgi:hypothetical protein